MPKKPPTNLIRCQYFLWRLYCRDEVYYADGRGNSPSPGRHSLGTRDRQTATENLQRLDLNRAIALGFASPTTVSSESHKPLTLDEGRRLYEQHLQRPQVAGGVRASTRKRYSTVFDKFIAFSTERNILVWNNVTRNVLLSYAAHLETRNYKSKTLRNELTTLGQAIRWLVSEGHLTGVDPPQLKLKKVESERAYCYEQAEVHAIINHCRSRNELTWLANVVIGLACTGLRISELAALRWTDVDLDREMLTLTDESGYGGNHHRQLKGGRSRSLPIHPDLMVSLKNMPRRGPLVHRGPRGGKLKPDTVRNILIRDVIEPLASQFPGQPGKKSFLNGRLHSFRHYFASACANKGIPERIVMDWLGHADSAMVRHYYHLHDDVSRQEMGRLDLINTTGKRSPGLENEAAQT